MNLFEAWHQWAHGQLAPTTILWGHQLFWWARAGKVAQAMGGLTIVAEIIGPERLRKFGNSLHGRVTVAKSVTYLKDCYQWIRATFIYLTVHDQPDREKAADEESERHTFLYYAYYILVGPFSLFVAFIATILILFRFGSVWWRWLVFGPLLFLAILLCSALSLPLLLGLGLAFFVILGTTLDLVLIEPLAWIIDRPRLDYWLKVFALLLLLVGFHFDFLAS
jgi:hypothetical protein